MDSFHNLESKEKYLVQIEEKNNPASFIGKRAQIRSCISRLNTPKKIVKQKFMRDGNKSEKRGSERKSGFY